MPNDRLANPVRACEALDQIEGICDSTIQPGIPCPLEHTPRIDRQCLINRKRGSESIGFPPLGLLEEIVRVFKVLLGTKFACLLYWCAVIVLLRECARSPRRSGVASEL